jgi:hypothetical protein
VAPSNRRHQSAQIAKRSLLVGQKVLPGSPVKRQRIESPRPYRTHTSGLSSITLSLSVHHIMTPRIRPTTIVSLVCRSGFSVAGGNCQCAQSPLSLSLSRTVLLSRMRGGGWRMREEKKREQQNGFKERPD